MSVIPRPKTRSTTTFVVSHSIYNYWLFAACILLISLYIKSWHWHSHILLSFGLMTIFPSHTSWCWSVHFADLFTSSITTTCLITYSCHFHQISSKKVFAAFIWTEFYFSLYRTLIKNTVNKIVELISTYQTGYIHSNIVSQSLIRLGNSIIK